MSEDATLQKAVMAQLRWSPSIDGAHLAVTAKNGVVTLTGHVDNFAAKHVAEATVRLVEGVEAAENLRRGLDSIPPVSASDPDIISRLREGFLGVERAFVDLLKRNGIAKVDPTGMAFDPTRDQAMSEREGAEPGTVLQALSAAWTLNGRLLRPAMVVVAKGSPSSPPGAPAPRS